MSRADRCPRTPAAALSIALALFSGCLKPATVLRNGVAVPVEQAAEADFADGERLFQAKQYKGAAAAYQRILTELPQTRRADDAAYRMAQIYRIRKQPKNAIQMLEAVLSRYPGSDRYEASKEELGLVLFGEQEFARAAEMLAALDWKAMEEPRRARLEKVTRSAFDQAGQPAPKVRWLIALHDARPERAADPDPRREIVDGLDASLGLEDLKRLAQERDGRFPADYAYFKLAKIAYHQGNLDAARKLVTLFLNRFPNHEYSREAVELSEKLYRSERIDPEAIGLLVPLSGEGGAFGQQVLHGAALAMDLFGAPAADGSGPRLFVEDSGDTPEQAVEALNHLVYRRNVSVVVGPLFAKQSQAASIAAADLGLPIVSLSAAEGITSIGDTVFRNSLTKSEQAVHLAYLARDVLGIRRAAVLYPANNYGSEFMRFFWQEFEKRGGEIRGVESYDPAGKEYAPAIRKLVGLRPIELRAREICGRDQVSTPQRPCWPADKLPPIVDFEAIFVPDNYDVAAQIAPTLTYYDVRGVQLLGTNLWNTSELLQPDIGDYLQGAIFLDGFFRDKPMPPVPQFVQRFYSTFGREPTIFEASAFDSVGMLLQVIAKRSPGSRASFAEALVQVRDYAGVTGTLSFKANRDTQRALTALTIDGAKIVELQ